MSPIRTAIIGLSASAKTSWASNAHLPYLLSPRGRSKYEIIALCNTSIDAARRSIQHYNLPAETRAYEDPESLARDPDIELVVCCTRVDVHHPTILPSVKAGKAVYVEWPLAQDYEHVEQLVASAKESGSRTVVGVQGRLAPPVVKLRDLIQQGRIGKVLSSEVRAAGGSMDRDLLSSGIKYFTQSAVGGNVFTIGFGHLFDQVQHVLGELVDIRPHLQLQRPHVKIRDPATNEVTETVKSDVPDLILATASLAGSENTQDSASVLLRFRRGQPFKGEPALVWTINGEKGEIRLVNQGGTTLHAGGYSQPVTIDVHDFETDEVKSVPWEWQDWQNELPDVARSVGAVYERFAEGDDKNVPSFEDALVRHKQLNEILASWSEK
ncbi:Fc.00g054650.m01.CDS01 [Cosmosporella sp. VM-42]